MRTARVLVAMIVCASGSVPWAQGPGRGPSVTLQKPSQNDVVGVRHEVAGTVSDRRAKVWVVVHPRDTGDCWVQDATPVNSDGTWSGIARFGEEVREHSGRAFEVRAIANPRNPLKVGKVQCWPESQSMSDPVVVTRK